MFCMRQPLGTSVCAYVGASTVHICTPKMSKCGSLWSSLESSLIAWNLLHSNVQHENFDVITKYSHIRQVYRKCTCTWSRWRWKTTYINLEVTLLQFIAHTCLGDPSFRVEPLRRFFLLWHMTVAWIHYLIFVFPGHCKRNLLGTEILESLESTSDFPGAHEQILHATKCQNYTHTSEQFRISKDCICRHPSCFS